ncbi:MAG: GDYXXLXY domain-containing protein [Gemmatimonadaceae bacterium]
MKRVLVAVGLALALSAPNYAIWQKERLLASGTPMLLALAPVDPRSLMQGDYMRLDYAVVRSLTEGKDWPRDGRLVVTLDSSGVARFVRRDAPNIALATGERLLRYRRRGTRISVGSNAFHFQEGDAARYARARFGELRVDAQGTSVLVGLRDASRVPLR